jgi:hypothetical protein
MNFKNYLSNRRNRIIYLLFYSHLHVSIMIIINYQLYFFLPINSMLILMIIVMINRIQPNANNAW